MSAAVVELVVSEEGDSPTLLHEETRHQVRGIGTIKNGVPNHYNTFSLSIVRPNIDETRRLIFLRVESRRSNRISLAHFSPFPLPLAPLSSHTPPWTHNNFAMRPRVPLTKVCTFCLANLLT